MLLAHQFADPQLNLTLELFLRLLTNFFGQQLMSVILYGSVVFDDLAPGYGDLDFLAVTGDDLPDEVCRQLVEIRQPLRSGRYGMLAQMLEGVFLPWRMLNPANAGQAFWWGTSGEGAWSSNRLGSLHSVDWLLTAARLLCWLQEGGRLCSKSEAADWAYLHAGGDWRKLLPRAKEMRLNPAMGNLPAAKQWLDALMGPIREAGKEVERALITQGFRPPEC